MTINGMWKWVKNKKSGIELREFKAKEFYGKILPIDAFGYAYKSRYGSKKKFYSKVSPGKIPKDIETNIDNEWFGVVLKDIMHWMYNYRCLPLFVMDGPVISLKIKTLEDRSKRYEKMDIEIKEYEEKAQLTAQELAKYRTLLIQSNIFPESSKKSFVRFLNDIGIPCLTVQGDAERYCSLLSKELSLPGVISNDSDSFAHGATAVLLEEEYYISKNGNKHYYYTGYKTEDVLQAANMDLKKFVDWCIMCGTDYNENIEDVGIVRSLTAISNVDCIEDLHLNRNDRKILKYHKVRKAFEQIPSKELIISGSLEPAFNKENIFVTLEEYGLEDHLDDYLSGIKRYRKSVNN